MVLWVLVVLWFLGFWGFFVLCNVDTYIQTQLKRKLFEVVFEADSSVKVFVFVTLKQTQKESQSNPP